MNAQSSTPLITASSPRVVVVGATGSGKTTTAAQLSRLLGIPHVELNSLHWMKDWVAVDREPFRSKVTDALAGPAWVTDGNYEKARDIIWGRATTLIWLDYPLPVVVWQLFARTMRRVITREELWNGNHETLRGTFFSRDSLLVYILQSQPRQRREFPQLFNSAAYSHLQVLHFRARRETTEWLLQMGHALKKL